MPQSRNCRSTCPQPAKVRGPGGNKLWRKLRQRVSQSEWEPGQSEAVRSTTGSESRQGQGETAADASRACPTRLMGFEEAGGPGRDITRFSQEQGPQGGRVLGRGHIPYTGQG
eukprot:gene9908-biopygen12270